MSVPIFIDTNQYLKLFGVVRGKEMLEAIEEQREYIFVSVQIVGEVMRRKLSCAKDFFSAKIKEIEEVSAEVPDHLLGIDAKKVASFRDIFTKAREAINEIREFESRGFVADKSVRGRGFDTLGGPV